MSSLQVLNLLCRLASISVVEYGVLCAEFHHAGLEQCIPRWTLFQPPPFDQIIIQPIRKMKGKYRADIKESAVWKDFRPKRTNEFEFKKELFISANDEKHLICVLRNTLNQLPFNGGIINFRDLFPPGEIFKASGRIYENHETMMSSPYLSMTQRSFLYSSRTSKERQIQGELFVCYLLLLDDSTHHP
jgi:hypothetical protein